jgi:hypothetical protein
MILIFWILASLGWTSEKLSPDERFHQAKAFYTNYEYNRSLSLIYSILKEDTFHSNSLRLLALIHENNKEYFKALKIHYKLLRHLYPEKILILEPIQLKKRKVPRPHDEALYSFNEVIRLSIKMLNLKKYQDREELKRIAKKYLIILEKNKLSLDAVYFYNGMLAILEKNPQLANIYFSEYQNLPMELKNSSEMNSFVEIYRGEYLNNQNISEYFWRLDAGLGYDSNPYSLDKDYYKGKETNGDSFQSVYGSIGKKSHIYSNQPSEWTLNYFRRSYQDEAFFSAEESHFKAFYETSTRERKERRFFHKTFFEWHRYTDFRTNSTQTLRQTYAYQPGIEFFGIENNHLLTLELGYHTYRELVESESSILSTGIRFRSQVSQKEIFLNPGYGASLTQSTASGDLKNSFDIMWQLFNDSYFFQDQKLSLKFKSITQASSDKFTNLSGQIFEIIYYIPLNSFDLSFFLESQKMKNDFINVGRNIMGVNLILTF